MRARHLMVTIGVLLTLVGCSPAEEPAAAPLPLPPVRVVEVPAASAGGACFMWDYAFLEEQLGVLFDVAAADRVDDVSTCVVRSSGAERPDLSMSVVERTQADAELFAEDLAPARSTTVKGLGKAAYRLISKASGDHGPVVEVGWLSADRQVVTLRFTFARGALPTDATDMGKRLVALARNLNGDSGT